MAHLRQWFMKKDAVTPVYVVDDLKSYLTLAGDTSRACESFDVNVFGSYSLELNFLTEVACDSGSKPM